LPFTNGRTIPCYHSDALSSFGAIRRRDGLEMIVTSNRAGTVRGLDLWVSTRDSV